MGSSASRGSLESLKAGLPTSVSVATCVSEISRWTKLSRGFLWAILKHHVRRVKRACFQSDLILQTKILII